MRGCAGCLVPPSYPSSDRGAQVAHDEAGSRCAPSRALVRSRSRDDDAVSGRASAPIVARTSHTARTGEGRPIAGRRAGVPRGMSSAAAGTSARSRMLGHDICVIAACRFCEPRLWSPVFISLSALLPRHVAAGRRRTPLRWSSAAPAAAAGQCGWIGRSEYTAHQT